MDSVDQDIINVLISASSSEILCSWSEIEQELPPAASTRQRRREVQDRPSSSSSDEGLNRTQHPMKLRRSKRLACKVNDSNCRNKPSTSSKCDDSPSNIDHNMKSSDIDQNMPTEVVVEQHMNRVNVSRGYETLYERDIVPE